jgi:hypothetical protein
VSSDDLQPDVEDVLQVEDPEGSEPSVKVEQQGPVRTQQLPFKAAASFTKTGIGTFTDPTGRAHLLRPDHRRGLAYIVSPQDFYISFSAFGATQQATSAFWPRSVPCPVAATVDVYVSATAGFADVSVISQAWATGEGPA